MKITFTENNNQPVQLIDMAVNALYRTETDEFCIRLNDSTFVFIDETRGFSMISTETHSDYTFTRYRATKLHNVKIDISFDC